MDEFRVVCSLARMSVFETEEDIPDFTDWVKVIINADRNEVSRLCYEAAKSLPEVKRPVPVLMERWKRCVQKDKENFQHRKEVVGQLRDMLENKGIAMLMLGGDALADYYPDPELHEGGVVKFVARTNFEGCNALVKDLGVKVKVQDECASFLYNGVNFENFRMGVFGDLTTDTVWRRDGCLEPDPVTQAILVVDNAARCAGGLWRKVPLRMMLDLALILRRYPSVTDDWKSGLRQAGLRHFAEVMLCGCDTLLKTGFRDGWGCLTRLRAGRLYPV